MFVPGNWTFYTWSSFIIVSTWELQYGHRVISGSCLSAVLCLFLWQDFGKPKAEYRTSFVETDYYCTTSRYLLVTEHCVNVSVSSFEWTFSTMRRSSNHSKNSGKNKTQDGSGHESQNEPDPVRLRHSQATTCTKNFTDLSAQLLLCERCMMWWGGGCAKVTETGHKILSRPNLHWFC